MKQRIRGSYEKLETFDLRMLSAMYHWWRGYLDCMNDHDLLTEQEHGELIEFLDGLQLMYLRMKAAEGNE